VLRKHHVRSSLPCDADDTLGRLFAGAARASQGTEIKSLFQAHNAGLFATSDRWKTNPGRDGPKGGQNRSHRRADQHASGDFAHAASEHVGIARTDGEAPIRIKRAQCLPCTDQCNSSPIVDKHQPPIKAFPAASIASNAEREKGDSAHTEHEDRERHRIVIEPVDSKCAHDTPPHKWTQWLMLG
jgi:hypothetical protein